ncbi:MAG: Sapep family Mn(2+)-dependent dipeptidase [Clostridia bacterium]|jgi:succinyl-diaminopimelate desuccinylase|nr:Sapep family Mn(2+)-dependent dipeptidase [Clostridia bacterium]
MKNEMLKENRKLEADELFEKLDIIINGFAGNMVKGLSEFLAIPSTESEEEPNAPFGAEVAKALAYYKELAEKLGFSCYNNAGYYVTADWQAPACSDKAAEIVGVLSHCDVVPAGKGWHYPPFGGLVEEGYIYGRGAQDDKGPTIAAIYAMAALKEAGFNPKRSLRHIVGGNEESGCACIEKYLAEDKPLWGGFSPDGDFPLIFAEKGIARFKAELEYDEAEFKECKVHAIHGGTVGNAVPGEAEAGLTLSPVVWEKLKKQAENYTKGELELLEDETKITVKACGKACHASTPDKGKNAIGILLSAILPIMEGRLGEWLKSIYKLYGKESYGKGSNTCCKDEVSGCLTLNLGTIHAENGKAKIELDMRYPVEADFGEIWQKMAATAAEKRVCLQMLENKAPLYVPKDRETVTALMRVYRQMVDVDAEPIAIGGGTYCRYLKNFVAFGPIFPEGEDRMHQADERVKVEQLLFLSKIYAVALYELAF